VAEDERKPEQHESGPEPIVELANYSSRFEADVILAKLQANGIEATVEHSELGGGAYGSALTIDSTHRIFVFKRDLEDARLLVREE
jgi:hypothetical protein